MFIENSPWKNIKKIKTDFQPKLLIFKFFKYLDQISYVRIKLFWRNPFFFLPHPTPLELKLQLKNSIFREKIRDNSRIDMLRYIRAGCCRESVMTLYKWRFACNYVYRSMEGRRYLHVNFLICRKSKEMWFKSSFMWQFVAEQILVRVAQL